MCARKLPEPGSAGSRIEALLTWLGGADRGDLAERHERSSHVISGVVVLVNATLAWLVAALALAGSTHWPIPGVFVVTFVFGLLVGAVSRAIAAGPTRGWPGIVARGGVGLAIGVIVGELAALVVFSGSIDRRLNAQAVRDADSAPAVVQAAADLDRTRALRTALDDPVERARERRDEALVVARCEYNPTPACPQTRITGVPGAGPETRTANDFLADAQRELDDALATRDREAPPLDARVADAAQVLRQARKTAIAGADRGLGAHLVALQDREFAGAGVLLLQLVTIAFFALLSVLPLIIKLWRGETTQDRNTAAHAERDRAELEADTSIAVKRAQVRAAAETLWAEQQLANTRLAVEAQTEIDRAQYRRRVAEALQRPVHAASQRKKPQPPDEDMYLPIAAEAEAASLAAAAPAGDPQDAGPEKPENLPAAIEPPVEPGAPAAPRREAGTPPVPTIPGVAKAAARWIRPFVPPFVARAFDTTTQPLRAARHMFEEVEEITFTLKRTHKVTVHFEETTEHPRQRGSVATDARVGAQRADSSADATDDAGADSPRLTGAGHRAELTKSTGQRELPAVPRQLPPPAG